MNATTTPQTKSFRGKPVPADACAPPADETIAAAAAGKIVLAARGDCSFIEKAEAVDGGPSGRIGALIVTNNEASLFRMGASPRREEENALDWTIYRLVVGVNIALSLEVVQTSAWYVV